MYDIVKNQIINELKKKFPNFKYTTSSQVGLFIDVISYLQQFNEEKIDSQISEIFLDSQTDIQSIKSTLDLFPYERRFVLPQRGFVSFFISPNFLNQINHFKHPDSDVQFVIKDDSELKQGNIEFHSIEQTNKLSQENLNILLLNNQSFKFSTYVIQYQYRNFIDTNTFTVYSMEPYNKFKLDIPNNQYIIPSSIEQILIDEYNKEHPVQQNLQYSTLFESIQDGKIQLLLEFDETEQQWYQILQKFFNQYYPNGTLKIRYKYSLGENGNIKEKQINVFVHLEDNFIIRFKDKQGIDKEYTFGMFQDMQKQSNLDIGQNDILFFNELQFNNGLGMESIEEYIQNQIKYNKTNKRQITYEDFVDLTHLFLKNYVPHMRFKFTISSDLSWMQNIVRIFLLLRDSQDNIVEGKEFEDVQKQLQIYLTEISPLGMIVTVEKQSIKKQVLSGIIRYDSKVLTHDLLKKIIREQIINYESKVQVSQKTIDTKEIINYLLQQNGIYYQNLEFRTWDNVKQTYVQKGSKFQLQYNEILEFENVSKIFEFIKFQGG